MTDLPPLDVAQHIYNDLEGLQVEALPPDQVYPNPWNPNRQSKRDYDLLLASIREHGFTVPILINQDGMIVDGEHRWRAARELKLPQLLAIRVQGTLTQLQKMTLRMNRARGADNLDKVREMLKDLQSAGALPYAQGMLGLSDAELRTLIDQQTAAEALAATAYSQAWVPDPQYKPELVTETAADPTLRKTIQTSRTELKEAAATPAAVQAAARREADMTAIAMGEQTIGAGGAMTAEDKLAAGKKRLHTFTFIFTGDQAGLVRRVLGDRPAETFVKICQWKAEALNGHS